MTSAPNPWNSFSARPDPLAYESRTEASYAIGRFMNAVYAWMFAGLALTACVAWYVGEHTAILQQLGGAIWLLFLVEIALVIAISSATHRISASVATLLFMAYAALNGVTLSVLFLMYAHSLLAGAFAVTAGTFGVMSIYGFATRRDLSGVGSIAFMGLIGIIIASIVSIFWHPTWLTVAINYIGVLVFVALTAYDTQRLKAVAVQTAGDGAMAGRLAVNGALMLYLDFLNLFLFILRILGGRDSR